MANQDEDERGDKDRGKVVPIRQGHDALQAFLRTTAFGGDPRRPHVGQPWTFTGERGKRVVPSSLSFRDLGDVLVATLAKMGEVEKTVTGKDTFDHIDRDAVAQEFLLRLEKQIDGCDGGGER